MCGSSSSSSCWRQSNVGRILITFDSVLLVSRHPPYATHRSWLIDAGREEMAVSHHPHGALRQNRERHQSIALLHLNQSLVSLVK